VPASKNERLERVEVSQVQNGEAFGIYSEGYENSMISPANSESNSIQALVTWEQIDN
jgi:hypothetical protein